MAVQWIRDSSGKVIGHTITTSNGCSSTHIKGKTVSTTVGNWTRTYDSKGRTTSITNNKNGWTHKY